MSASIKALEAIAKEMKKKGIQKIAMMGKTDPKTMDKMEAMGDSSDSMASEESKDEEESPMHEMMSGDSKEDMVEGEPHGEEDPELTDKLAMIKKLLALKA